MRRLFIQFYLLLIGCFGLAILLIGLVYQVSAERAGDRYLEHMMQGSLGLLTGELARLPPTRWPARMGSRASSSTCRCNSAPSPTSPWPGRIRPSSRRATSSSSKRMTPSSSASRAPTRC